MELWKNATLVSNLPIESCILLDLPNSKIDCSIKGSECIRCHILGRFVSGVGIDEYNSTSHILCILLWLITCVFGTFGIFANLLVIAVLHQQKPGTGYDVGTGSKPNRNQAIDLGRAFDTFLVGLAGFDILCSLASIVGATAAVFYFQNWSRNAVTLFMFSEGTLVTLFSRSGSSFMTVLTTLDRFLVVAYPMKLGSWFTVKKARYLVFGVVIWALLLGLPRFSGVYIGRNVIGKHIKSTAGLDYLILSTRLNKFWYVDMMGFFDQIDFWTPLPLLLLFNGLLYFYVRKFEKRRLELNRKHRKDIRTAKMFLPVVIVLFLCNIEPIIHYYFIFRGVVYRELYMGILVSFTLNSAVNLPIYYLGGSNFRKKTRAILIAYFPFLTGIWQKKVEGTPRSPIIEISGTASSDARNDNEKYY